MLPSFLFPSCKQYKTDSDAVANWLAETAVGCGYPRELLVGEVAFLQKVPKLKGRARKLAREAAQTKPTASTNNQADNNITSGGAKHLIAVKDFISLAEWISKSQSPRVKVHDSFFKVLDRAITVKKRHQEWWYGRPNQADVAENQEELNKSHSHFIGILEQVRSILSTRSASKIVEKQMMRFASSEPIVKDRESLQLVNLFANLEIEAPADAHLRTESDAQQSGCNVPGDLQYGLQREQDLVEVYFAVHCFLNDIDNIRRYLQEVWKGYKTGNLELVPVAVVTNTALEFVKSMHEDFVHAFPQHADFEDHIRVLYVQQCHAMGIDSEYRERPNDEMNFAVYDNVEPLLFPIAMLMSTCSTLIQPDTLMMFKPGHDGPDDLISGRQSNSSREKFREGKHIVYKLMPEFCYFTMGTSIFPQRTN